MDNSKYTNSFFLFFLYEYELIKLSFCIETLKKPSKNLLFDTSKELLQFAHFLWFYFLHTFISLTHTENGILTLVS